MDVTHRSRGSIATDSAQLSMPQKTVARAARIALLTSAFEAALAEPAEDELTAGKMTHNPLEEPLPSSSLKYITSPRPPRAPAGHWALSHSQEESGATATWR